MTLLGPEKLGIGMEVKDDEDLAEAAGRGAVERVVHHGGSSDDGELEAEKGEKRHVEG